MQRDKNLPWSSDFDEFQGFESGPVPRELSEGICEFVGSQLHPSALLIFAKLSLVQFAVGLVTLLFCPQFGFALTSSLGFMPELMRISEGVCMLGCGAFFAGSSLLVASLVLKTEEVRTLKRHALLQLGGVATLSLGLFVCFGAETVLTLGLIWMLGAILGGVMSLEAGWYLRQQLVRRALV